MLRSFKERGNRLLVKARYWILVGLAITVGLYAGLAVTEAILATITGMGVILLYRIEDIYNRPSVRQVDVRVDAKLDPEDSETLREIRDILKERQDEKPED